MDPRLPLTLVLPACVFFGGCPLRPPPPVPPTIGDDSPDAGQAAPGDAGAGAPIAVTHHRALLQPPSAPPAALSELLDPVFASRVTRMTNAAALSPPKPGLFPQYSKRQAWNADESYLLLSSDDGTMLLYDARKTQFLKVLEGVGGEDVFWHGSRPDLILYVGDKNLSGTTSVPVLYAYEVLSEERQEVFQFDGFQFANTRGEGQLSADGKSYAVVASTYDAASGEVQPRKLKLISIETQGDRLVGTEVSSLSLPAQLNGLDWVSVSPSGQFIVVDYATTDIGPFQGVEVYDRAFHLLWRKPLGAGHSDLGTDASGTDFLLMDVYDSDANLTRFKRFDLATGAETPLLSISPLFDQHISCKNQVLKGYCFISTFDFVERLADQADDPKLDWLPFEDEVFALRVDGSQQVVRLAHHHSRRFSPATPDSDSSVYFAEPHATVNRSATRLLFGSNWRANVGQVGSIDTYQVDFSALLPAGP